MPTSEEIRDRITIMREPLTVTVTVHDTIVAQTRQALRLVERGHAPVFYIPRSDVEMALLTESEKRTTCPFKGEASYWSITIADGRTATEAVWSYERPHEAVEEIAGAMAFRGDGVTVTVGGASA